MKKENHQHAKDKKGAIDERYIQLTLHVCRIFYSLTRPEVQVHSFAEYGKRPAYQCLTGYHGCYSGHYHANEKEFPRHDGIKRIYPFMQTVNRAALPAIFNPEDLNALEQALRLKDQNPGSTVGMLTMGPPRAGEIIRQGLYRGADTGWLLTDRLFAGADTLATSYALATAIKKIGGVDVVIGGRQAIDGDTAQVGPQVAQKLDLNQVTYAEEVLKIEDNKATIRRHIDGGVETVEAPLPVVITVNGSAAPARPCNAKLVMKYK